MINKKKVILFGAPGSGKGTQAVELCKHWGVPKISVGDILREEVKKQSSLGKELKSYMDKGLLVPDEVVSRVIEENISNTDGFVLDGYPRNFNQAVTLEDIFKRKNINYDAFIYFQIGQAKVIERLSKRQVCKKCAAVYHMINMPSKKEGICDNCGGQLIQRDDDKPEVIKKRMDVFLSESEKVVSFYSGKKKLLTVDGGLNKDLVFEKITSKLG